MTTPHNPQGKSVVTKRADATLAPKYDPAIISKMALLEIVEQHPTRLTIKEIVMRIVGDPDDGREVETVTDAVRDLRRACLVHYRNDDELVAPTQAALCAYDLLNAL